MSAIKTEQLPLITFTEKKQQRLQDNVYAPLEPKTKRILERLKKRLSAQDKQITQEGLSESRNKIQLWLQRHTAQRVQVHKSPFQLFSEGKNAANMSRRVENMRERLKTGFFYPYAPLQDLKGRVTKKTSEQNA